LVSVLLSRHASEGEGRLVRAVQGTVSEHHHHDRWMSNSAVWYLDDFFLTALTKVTPAR